MKKEKKLTVNSNTGLNFIGQLRSMPNTPQKMQVASSKTRIEFRSMGHLLKISTSSERVAVVALFLVALAIATFGVVQLTSHRADKTTSTVSIPEGSSSMTTTEPVVEPADSIKLAPVVTQELRQTADGTGNKNTVELRKTAKPASQPTKLIQKANGNQNINSVVIE